MADCSQHPGTRAVASCAGCAEAYCGNCLVTVKGKSYCAGCKGMAVSPDAGPRILCPEASEALKYAIVGIFCFGIILEPVAIMKAVKAKQMLRDNPSLEGAGRANAALVIGSLTLILWVVGMYARFHAVASGPSGF